MATMSRWRANPEFQNTGLIKFCSSRAMGALGVISSKNLDQVNFIPNNREFTLWMFSRWFSSEKRWDGDFYGDLFFVKWIVAVQDFKNKVFFSDLNFKMTTPNFLLRLQKLRSVVEDNWADLLVGGEEKCLAQTSGLNILLLAFLDVLE